MGPPTEDGQFLKVLDLIHRHSREWNWEMIRKYLPAYEERIKNILLSHNRMEDSQVWLPAKNGVYTPKSGYATLKLAETFNLRGEFNWQHNIWRVRTVPKIQHFLWRAMVRALPVYEQMVKRGMMATGSNCKRCGQIESIDHFLFQCAFAQRTWELAPIQLTTFASTPTVIIFLEKAHTFKNLPPTGVSDVDMFAWVCWHLWKARNLFVFDNRTPNETDVLLKAQQDALAWSQAQSHVQSPSVSPLLNHDSISHDDWNCFIDAAWDKASGSCGIGTVFKFGTNGNSEALIDSRYCVNSALMAEAWALKRGMEMAILKGIRKAHFYSDSTTLISLLHSGEERLEISCFLFDIRIMCSDFSEFSVSFVPRTANVEADSVAKQALRNLQSVVVPRL